MKIIFYDISNITGEEVKGVFKWLVDNKWDQNTKYQFKINGKSTVEIKVCPNATQLGNGFLSFPRYDAPTSWKNCEQVLMGPRFPRYYSNFRRRKMSSIEPVDADQQLFFQTSILLQFEVARRVEWKPMYNIKHYDSTSKVPIVLSSSSLYAHPYENPASPSREETERAIDIALRMKGQKLLVEMFTKKMNHEQKSRADFPGRRKAYEKLLELEEASYTETRIGAPTGDVTHGRTPTGDVTHGRTPTGDVTGEMNHLSVR